MITLAALSLVSLSTFTAETCQHHETATQQLHKILQPNVRDESLKRLHAYLQEY